MVMDEQATKGERCQSCENRTGIPLAVATITIGTSGHQVRIHLCANCLNGVAFICERARNRWA